MHGADANMLFVQARTVRPKPPPAVGKHMVDASVQTDEWLYQPGKGRRADLGAGRHRRKAPVLGDDVPAAAELREQARQLYDRVTLYTRGGERPCTTASMDMGTQAEDGPEDECEDEQQQPPSIPLAVELELGPEALKMLQAKVQAGNTLTNVWLQRRAAAGSGDPALQGLLLAPKAATNSSEDRSSAAGHFSKSSGGAGLLPAIKSAMLPDVRAARHSCTGAETWSLAPVTPFSRMLMARNDTNTSSTSSGGGVALPAIRNRPGGVMLSASQEPASAGMLKNLNDLLTGIPLNAGGAVGYVRGGSSTFT
jgi:hypothetical protein